LSDGASALDPAIAPAIDTIVATLRSGGTLRDGLDAVAAAGPLGPTVRTVLVRADAGVGLRDAVATGARVHPSADIRFVMAAMTLALDTGAAQAATLDVVAQRVRERVALRREVRAAAASARASAMVVAAAPFAFALVVAAVDPSVVLAALRTSGGRACVPAGLVLEAIGVWWMQRLARGPLHTDPRDPLDDLPELVDLIGLAVSAGLGVPAAVALAAPHAPGPAGRAARLAAARLTAGVAPAVALLAWPGQLGDEVRPLATALVAAHHDGAPVGPTLAGLASDLRHARRVRAIERVHRLPVLLLFPLVCCVLPAFVLLTVVPLALGSLGALRG
jgi:Flp pilus assembly protein TadB